MSRRVLSPEELKATEAKLKQATQKVLALADAAGKKLFIAEFDSKTGKLDSCSPTLSLPGIYSALVLDRSVRAKLEASAASSPQFFACLANEMLQPVQYRKILRETVRMVKSRRGWGGPKVTRGRSEKSVAIDDMKAEECLTLIDEYARENVVELPVGIAALLSGSSAIDFAIQEGGKMFCKNEIYIASGLRSILDLPYDRTKDGRSLISEETGQKRKDQVCEINSNRAAKKKSMITGNEGGSEDQQEDEPAGGGGVDGGDDLEVAGGGSRRSREEEENNNDLVVDRRSDEEGGEEDVEERQAEMFGSREDDFGGRVGDDEELGEQVVAVLLGGVDDGDSSQEELVGGGGGGGRQQESGSGGGIMVAGAGGSSSSRHYNTRHRRERVEDDDDGWNAEELLNSHRQKKKSSTKGGKKGFTTAKKGATKK